MCDEDEKLSAGEVFVKIPRSSGGGAGDITGGLPRVTELFEARNPSNPAVVSEIDGVVELGKIKRGNREIKVTSRLGEERSISCHCQSRFLCNKTTLCVPVLHCPTVQPHLPTFSASWVQQRFRNIS